MNISRIVLNCLLLYSSRSLFRRDRPSRLLSELVQPSNGIPDIHASEASRSSFSLLSESEQHSSKKSKRSGGKRKHGNGETITSHMIEPVYYPKYPHSLPNELCSKSPIHQSMSPMAPLQPPWPLQLPPISKGKKPRKSKEKVIIP